MQAALFKVIVAMEAIWWQGQTLEGAHGWDPSILHASALNHAVCSALGIEGIRGNRIRLEEQEFERRLHHSRVSQKVWVSPAKAVFETLRPVDTTLVSIVADYGHMQASPPPKGQQRLILSDDGKVDFRAPGIESDMGRPKKITGWLGEWEGRIFWEDSFDMPEDLVIYLGPVSAQCLMKIGPCAAVVEDSNPEGVEADHLMDSTLLDDDAEIVREVGAMPWALAEVVANARVGESPVYRFW